ncbi:MAG TPA: DUF6114 domain-containing protein [Streptosporangiaceae bacterium]
MARSLEDADSGPAGPGGAAGEPVNGVRQDAFGAFYRWRHSRPFWGGLLVLLGGAEILLSERAPLPVVIHVGIQGLAGYLVPAILLLCGLLLWFTPEQRTFYSILAVLLALGSWITSNLGGFFVGMAMGLVGGSLAFAWSRGSGSPARQRRGPRPRQPPPRQPPAPRRREPSGGLDLILGGPRKSSRPVRAPGRRRRPPSEDTAPIRDNPRGQNAGAVRQPAQGSAPRTGRLPAGSGRALLLVVARLGA